MLTKGPGDPIVIWHAGDEKARHLASAYTCACACICLKSALALFSRRLSQQECPRCCTQFCHYCRALGRASIYGSSSGDSKKSWTCSSARCHVREIKDVEILGQQFSGLPETSENSVLRITGSEEYSLTDSKGEKSRKEEDLCRPCHVSGIIL